MTLCLTGDVHHMSLATKDQKYMQRSEVDVALEYAEIAAAHQIPVTLFITGKAAVEEPDKVRQLIEMDHVEVGGHGYYAFDTPIHEIWRGLGKLTGALVGSWNGPRPFQRWEIHKTKETIEELGTQMTAWRDHAYRHDKHTVDLLADAGITHFSDKVSPDEEVYQTSGMTIVPVNTPPDHEHVYHAFRQPGSDAVQEFSGPFGTESVPPDEWVDWVIERVQSIDAEDGVATVLAHPSCLWLADEFASFKTMCRRLSDIESVRMSELNRDS